MEQFGRDFLMNAPGWKKEELPDGGIYLQLSPEVTDKANGPSHEELARYFAPVGVRYLDWPKGYKVTPTGEVK